MKGTKRRAQSELNDLLSKLQRGEYVAPTGTTVAVYLECRLADYAVAVGTSRRLLTDRTRTVAGPRR